MQEGISVMSHNKINYLEKLHEGGYRLTQQRQTILESICEAEGHATIADIYLRTKKLDKGINRSTIYRTLDLFVKLGLVICGENIHGERVYELIKEQHHHHLICKECGNDVEIDNQVVDSFYQNLKHEYSYEVKMDHLIVFGVCSHCSITAG